MGYANIGTCVDVIYNTLHSILGWFKVGLGWLVNANSSQSIHNAKEVGPQSTKGSFPIMQGDGFASELGGIMEVAYHY